MEEEKYTKAEKYLEGESYNHRKRQILREKVIHIDRERFGGRKLYT